MEANQKELASILGLTDRRIRQLREEYGLFESGRAEGKKTKNYILEKCVPEYINYRLEAEVRQGTACVREKEQAEHERIKKKISILKLRKLRRELHEAEDVDEFLTDMLIRFRNHLLSLPAKVAPLVMAEDSLQKVMDVIEREVLETLDELSGYDPDKIDHESDSMATSDIEEDDDEEDD